MIRSAVTWAVGWTGLTLCLTGIQLSTISVHLPRWFWLTFITRQAIVGGINGAVFAAALIFIGRRRTFASLGIGRVALCGAIGGVVFPLIGIALIPAPVRVAITLSQLLAIIGVSAATGAVIGGGSLLLARRAPKLASPHTVLGIDGTPR